MPRLYLLRSLCRDRKIPTKISKPQIDSKYRREIHIQDRSLDTTNISLDFTYDIVFRVVCIEAVAVEGGRSIDLVVEVDEEIFCCEGEYVVGCCFGGGGLGG
jgi:hypothetical protein